MFTCSHMFLTAELFSMSTQASWLHHQVERHSGDFAEVQRKCPAEERHLSHGNGSRARAARCGFS